MSANLHRNLFRKHIALPQQHGSWALWLGPYAVGVGAAGALHPGLAWLTLLSLGAFLALQPLTILVKVRAGRRDGADFGAAAVWVAIYALASLIGGVGLLMAGFGYLLALGLVTAPVLAWQLWLVSRHQERRHMLVEMAGSVALASSSAAGYWVAGGAAGPDTTGWVLWLLCGWQASGAIAHIYVRLVHRRWTTLPGFAERARFAAGSLALNAGGVVLAIGLAAIGAAPATAVVAFALMAAEAAHMGVLRVGLGVKPVAIGVRQTVVTALFAAALIAAYRIG